jgi:dCTP deaminase
MSVKSDRWIKRMALEHGMISPFESSQVRTGVVSYGVSSYGYDIRVADEFKIFTNINSTLIDPKDFDPKSSRPTSASCRPTRSRWRAPWSTSRSRAT